MPPGVFELMEAADLAKRGAWPCGGGTHDQTQACLDGVRAVWAQDAQYRAALKLPPTD